MEKHRRKPVFLNHMVDDSHLFIPLPHPTGEYPYRMDIQNLLGDKTRFLKEQMSFHMVGDTGSARHSDFQALIASALSQQAAADMTVGEKPAFLFHLGDIVYNHGEASEYPKQFFVPYEDYPAAIVAIAGNHDADVNPDAEFPYQSLDAFMDVFCDTYPRRMMFGGGSKRLSMIQPNVYWTLITPLAHFIGLYANVTKYGTIADDQLEWFVKELRYAGAERPNKAIIVCVHQAPYTADTNHGSSLAMIDFLENAFKVAGVKPDIVFSGHVHNYQRFTKAYEDGTEVPYVVAGAGGYADLHRIACVGDSRVTDEHPVFDDVRLDNFCDDRFGFIKIGIERKDGKLLITGEYYTIPRNIMHGAGEAMLFERFFVPVGYPSYSLH
ncbi:metallophosphoesterase family protein [Parapedobacter tibetensis]|uniref:metallophosphoesterase family protein n=1 Tax=Parapedobacter tibetensis TaxID=2972951 RepID=UPI00214DEB55|nr:metallophosphoesterase [Parapedobacter tibetensis]